MRTRILTLIAGVVAIACGTVQPAFAQGPGQDTVRGDLAFSYSVLRNETAHTTFPAGFMLALAGDVNPKFRIVAEFGGNYKTVNAGIGTNYSLQIITYQGGLRFVPGGKTALKPFVQFLAGGARATTTQLGTGLSGGENAFAMQPGGGVDFRMIGSFDGRIQVDYRAIRSTGLFSHEYRVAFGIVFPFGR